MTEPSLTLFSSGLLSKWGFSDGDIPDQLLDWCDTRSIPYPADWHATLRHLVREHLIPALDQTVTVTEIETSHNPIRAETVDGVDVTECWSGDQDEPTLTPEFVDVPYSVVLAAAFSR
jgi:hypothetical protein